MNPNTGPGRDSPHALAGPVLPPEARPYQVRDVRRAERLMSSPLAIGYRPQMPYISVRGAEVLGWHFFADVEVMLMHDAVRLPLMYIMGPLGYAEWTIEASSRAVGLFAARQMQWYWQNAWPDQQREANVYGWAATELTYTDRDGLWCWDQAVTFNPRDVTVLIIPEGPRRGKAVGVRIVNMTGGTLDLWGFRDDVPNKVLWYAHQPRGGLKYGESQIRPAWRYWRRLAGVDGLEEIEDLAGHRFGTGVVVVRHPNTQIDAELAGLPNYAQNGLVHTRDIARFMSQNLKSGAGFTLSSEVWPTTNGSGGGLQWDVEVKSFTTNLEQLGQQDDRLTKKCSKVIGVPPELFEAAQTGSGFSGRAIPLQGFLISQQAHLQRATVAVVNQGIDPMVKWNFGPRAWVRFIPKPLTESVRKSSWDSPGDPASMVQPNPSSQGVTLPPPGQGGPGAGAADQGPASSGEGPKMLSAASRQRVCLVVTTHADGSVTAELPADPTELDLPDLLKVRSDLAEVLR